MSAVVAGRRGARTAPVVQQSVERRVVLYEVERRQVAELGHPSLDVAPALGTADQVAGHLSR